MKSIRNLKNKPLVFTLNDGSTFRLFPHDIKSLDKKLVSADLYRAELQGIILIEDEVQPEEVITVVEKPVVIEEDSQNLEVGEKKVLKKPKNSSRRLDHE